jgi:hypothetical protein
MSIMKRKVKQWWSSITSISTKGTITSHPNWTHWTLKDRGIWRWKSRSWLGMYLLSSKNILYVFCWVFSFLFFYSFIDVCYFETDGDFAHKTDCDKYYTCKEGIPTPKTCAPGQFFSRTSRQCDSYENVDCVVNDEGGMCTMMSEYVYSTCNKIG